MLLIHYNVVVQVPKWAEGAALRTALLKQSYMPPDLDMLFEVPSMPDLTLMFAQQRKRSVLAVSFLFHF
jgi:hypothetical protein